jgi:hypothetical protein
MVSPLDYATLAERQASTFFSIQFQQPGQIAAHNLRLARLVKIAHYVLELDGQLLVAKISASSARLV